MCLWEILFFLLKLGWWISIYRGTNLSDQETKTVFNYRLSRCRRTIENTFCIYVVRLQIFFGSHSTGSCNSRLYCKGHSLSTQLFEADRQCSLYFYWLNWLWGLLWIHHQRWMETGGRNRQQCTSTCFKFNGEQIHLWCKRCKREIQVIFQQQRGFSSMATARCSKD